MARSLVELKNIDLTLGDGTSRVHILKNLSLAISQGETVGIVGPSGSGKSTLLMVLAGLEKIDSGEITIAGTRIDTMSEDEAAIFRGKNIGIVFQSFQLIPNMTAWENAAVPLELAGNRKAFDIAKKELEAVGLGGRLNHYPASLSGGEQQRVAIARALSPNPRILVADEPTGNLDADTGKLIADLIFERARKHKLTTVLVTHDLGLAASCRRQVHVRNGLIEKDSGAAQ
ncbi:ABC transporter ATP-binding protein [uncultured Bartonella sp.]|uniref:ABC transporter ATP-binding protein n=1 Tax=uncultured Bartonella sp. TaxID=104108 RepID=UPI0025EE9EE9|nr:ABC transporter ATP-binding protein [uncultured Bartonella sp.]